MLYDAIALTSRSRRLNFRNGIFLGDRTQSHRGSLGVGLFQIDEEVTTSEVLDNTLIIQLALFRSMYSDIPLCLGEIVFI